MFKMFFECLWNFLEHFDFAFEKDHIVDISLWPVGEKEALKRLDNYLDNKILIDMNPVYGGQGTNFGTFDIDIEKLSVTNDVRVILTFDCDAANNWTLLNETYYRIRDGIPDYFDLDSDNDGIADFIDIVSSSFLLSVISAVPRILNVSLIPGMKNITATVGFDNIFMYESKRLLPERSGIHIVFLSMTFTKPGKSPFGDTSPSVPKIRKGDLLIYSSLYSSI